MDSVEIAVSHFVWFLAEGTIVSIDTFSDVHTQLQPPVTLNVSTKNVIISRLDGISLNNKENTTGLSSALNNAMRVTYNIHKTFYFIRDKGEIVIFSPSFRCTVKVWRSS